MWKSKKLAAYTMLELIIIMILTGILSAFTFSALGLFSQSFLTFQKITRRSYELTLLNKLLLKDIDQAQQVTMQGETSFSCQYPDKQVKYDFAPTYIVRKDMLVDTFHLSPQDYKYELLPTSETVIGRISFTLLISEQVVPYSFKKIYPADIFVNQNTELP